MLIATARLDLRPLAQDDLGELVALHAEPDVARFMRPLDRGQALERIRADERHWADRGYGVLAVREQGTGRFVGRVSLRHWPGLEETEVGWALRGDVRGRGYATEAARACADWGFRDFAIPYLTAMISPGNARSLALAERLGMALRRTDFKRGIPVLVYAVSRDDWQTRAVTLRS